MDLIKKRLTLSEADLGHRVTKDRVCSAPYEIAPLFREWLAEHFPGRAAKVMSHLQSMRGGHDNDPDGSLASTVAGAPALGVNDLLRGKLALLHVALHLEVDSTTNRRTSRGAKYTHKSSYSDQLKTS
jgi:hypothetical protein